MACFRPEFRKRATRAATTLTRILFLKVCGIYSTATMGGGGGWSRFYIRKAQDAICLKIKKWVGNALRANIQLTIIYFGT
jgi:hypothetical protein